MTTWREIVESVKSEVARDGWRLVALLSVPDWREIVSGWMQVGPAAAARAHSRPASAAIVSADLETRLAWAWAEVGDDADAALLAMGNRSAVSEGVLVQAFAVLQGNAVVLPDGTAHPGALRRIEREIAVRDVAATLRVSTAQSRIARSQRAAAKAQAETEGFRRGIQLPGSVGGVAVGGGDGVRGGAADGRRVAVRRGR